jgi:hypothetical protein
VATTYVALAADGLVAVVLGGKGLERGLNDATTETEDQVEGRLLWYWSVFRFLFHRRASGAPASTDLLDVVVRQGAAILKLLASEDETLLVWGNALLVLDLALHIVDGVGRLDLEGDGLARQGLNEAVAIYALVAFPSFAHVYSCLGRSVRFAGAVFGSRFRGREYVHLHC